jgi:hypothetical protein
MQHVAVLEDHKAQLARGEQRASADLSAARDALERCTRERSVLQGELVRSEEARLRVARALIDVDEENAGLKASLATDER